MKRANRLMLVAGVVLAAVAFVAVLAFANFAAPKAPAQDPVSLVMRSPGDYASADTPTTGVTLKELIDHWGVLPPKPVAP